MFLTRIALVLAVSGVFGILIGMFCRRREGSDFDILFSLVAAAFGGVGALVFEGAYPLLFQNLWSGFGEIFPVLLSPFVVLFVSRSPWLIVFGFAAGVAIGNIAVRRQAGLGEPGEQSERGESKERFGWIPLVVCVIAFFAARSVMIEHLAPGVEKVVRVIRFDDPERAGWHEQSYAWVEFIEANVTVGFDYESYPPEFYKKAFGGKDVNHDVPTFLFIKEYRRDGKMVAATRLNHTGPLSASELRQWTRDIARTQTSPP